MNKFDEMRAAAKFAGLHEIDWRDGLIFRANGSWHSWNPQQDWRDCGPLLCKVEQWVRKTPICLVMESERPFYDSYHDALASGDETKVMEATVKLAAAIQR